MEGVQILLLFLCGSLTLAEINDNGNLVQPQFDIFGPLNQKVYPILFTGIYSYYKDVIDKLSKLDLAEKKYLLAEYTHTYDDVHLPEVKPQKDPRLSEDIELQMNSDFKLIHKQTNRSINCISDWSTILNRAIYYDEKVHSLSDFSMNSFNKYEFIKFYRFLESSDYRDVSDLYLSMAAVGNVYTKLILQQNVCHRRMSMQQMLGNIRGHVVFSQAQALLSEWFAIDMMDFIKEKRNKLSSESTAALYFKLRSNYVDKFVKISKNHMVNASREVWRCDPTNHIHELTYTKLERAFQDFSSDEKAAKCDTSYQPICDNISGTSDRYFDLQSVFSNVYNNSVITGVRLIKKNHIVRIQIQEGQLLSNGMINRTSITWVPIKNYASCENCFVLSKSRSRTVDLDDVVLSNPNSLLTGISFTKVKKTNGEENLSLVVYSTPFNFTTGKLIINDDSLPWKAEYPKPKETQEHEKLDSNELSDNLNKLLRPSPIDQLTFNEKTLKTGDTVITPYIDLQPITTIPPSPMSGAGLIYRNETNEFLALKLFTYDMTPFLSTEDEHNNKYI